MPSPPSDALDSTLELVTRARGGEPRALELLASRYQTALRRFAHGRVPAEARGMVDTGDVVQVALTRTLGRLATIDASLTGSFLAYLRRAVVNQIRDQLRHARRRPAGEEISESLVADIPDPLEQAISREALDRYDAALAQLPADQQEAFLMRIEMDCSYREIADALGKGTSESARMLVRRAIRTLARLLRRSRHA